MVRQLTTEELLSLRAFMRQVDRLRNSKLLESNKVTFKYSTKINFGTGEVKTRFEGYDPIAFQSAMPIFRQFMLNDSISFNYIHNLINQCCDRQDLLEWARWSRKEWQATLGRLPVGEHRFFHNAQDNVDEAIQKLFYGYGGLFHVDINDPNEEESVREIQEATLQHAFPHFWNCLRNVEAVIYIWLDEPSKPVPPLPSK